MADRDLMAGIGVNQALDLGEPVYEGVPYQPRRPEAQQTTGLGSLRAGAADVAFQRERALGALGALEQLRPPRAATAAAMPRPRQASIYYDPTRNRYSVGGEEFGAEEYERALETRPLIGQQRRPTTPGNWQPISPAQYQQYLNSLAEGRGLFGNIGMGLRDIGEGLVGGSGRLLQKFGAEDVGGALVEAGEFLGPTEAQEARDVFIAEQQGLGGKIGTAVTRSIPSLALSIGSGVGAAGLAVRAGATAGGLASRSASLVGVSASILPLEMQSSWDAAEQGGYDTSDPQIRDEILYTALTKTAGQTFAPAFFARGFSPALRRVVSESAERTMGSRVRRFVGGGAMEGMAETFAVIADRVMFDPELRAEFNEADWAALAPLLVDKYGEEAFIAFGAGFLLGGPLGALGTPTQTPETGGQPSARPEAGGQPDVEPSDVQPRRDLSGDQAVNALTGTAVEPQAPVGIAPPAPPAGLLPPPTETTLGLPSPTQGGTVIPQAPLRLEGMLPPTLPLTPQQRTDTPVVLQPQARAEPGQVEMFTPTEMGVGTAAQARLTGRQLVGAPRPEVTVPSEPTQAELEVAGQRRMELTAQPTAMGEQFADILERQNRLRQQAEQAAATRARREAEFEAARRQVEQQAEQQRQRMVDADRAWEELRPEGSRVTFDRLTPTAQRQWSEAVSAETADRTLFNNLRRSVSPGPAQPLMETPTVIAEPARTSDRLANPIAPGVYGTTKGTPYKSRPSELAIKGVAKRVGVSASQLEIVEVPGGFGLRPKTEPARAPERLANSAVLQDAVPLPVGDGSQAPMVMYDMSSPASPQPVRAIVVKPVNGVRVPFYLSTGQGGKTDVASGRWYPFFGITSGMPWFVKTSGNDINNYYGSPELRRVAEQLDAELGDVRGQDAPTVTRENDDNLRETINRDMHPNTGLRGRAMLALPKGQRVNPNDSEGTRMAIQSVLDRIGAGRTPPTPPTSGAPSPLEQGRQAAQGRRQRGAARMRGETGALQEPSTAEVDVREQAPTGEEVRVGDTQEAGAPRARQAQDIFEQTEVAPRRRRELLPPRSTRQMAEETSQTAEDVLIGRDSRAPARLDQGVREAELKARLTERTEALSDEQAEALTVEVAAMNYKDIDDAIQYAPQMVEQAIGRVETRTRALEDTKARKAAEAPSVESATPPIKDPAALAEALWGEARSTREDRAEVSRFADLPEAQQKALVAAVGGSEYARLAEGLWNEIRSTREDRAEIPRFADLPEAQQKAWIAAVRGGEYASKESGPNLSPEAVEKWKNAGLKLPRTSDPVTTFQRTVDAARAADQPTETDLDMLIEAVDDAELDLKGGYPDEKTRAAIDLVILRDDPATPVDVQQRITDILETNLTQRQLQEAEVAAANETPGRASRTTFNFTDGQYTSLDGAPITRAMPHGKVKMVISNFRKKLKRAPKIKVFTNAEQLRRKNPELYARAAAAREQGDFDSITAAGYSFGDGEVLIFTDNIANDAHLRFVLAHETMGHYGLRGFIPADKFDAAMQAVYDSAPQIQTPIDAAVAANEGMSRAEAVEEFLSDYAALLETNIILRVRAAIKDVLNALGLKFQDDYMRYLLRNARYYARNPGPGRFANIDAIAQEAHRVENGLGTPGRYAQQQGIFDTTYGAMRFARMSLGDAPILASLKGTAQFNLPTTWQDANNELLSLFGYQARKNPGLQHGHELFVEAEENINYFRYIVNEVMAPALNGASKVMFTNLEFGGIKEEDVQTANRALAISRIRATKALREDPKLSQSKTPIFRYDEATGQLIPTGEAKRLDDLYRLKIEDFKEGVTVEYAREGTGEIQTFRLAGDKKMTKDSPAFKAYNAARDGFLMAEMHALRSKMLADTATMTNILEDIEGALPEGQRLTSEQRQLIKRAARLYNDLYSKGAGVNPETGELQNDPAAIARADAFLQAFNTAIIADKPAAADPDLGNPNSVAARNKTLADIVAKEAGQQEADDMIVGIENFKDAVRTEAGRNRLATTDNKFLVQTKIAAINHTQFQAQNGEQGFRNRITAQYTPIEQKGRFQLKMHAVDAQTGAYVALGDEYAAAMGYTQFATRAEAKQFAETLRKQLRNDDGSDVTFTVRAGVPSKKGEADSAVAEREIKIATTIDMVETDVLAPARQSLSEFMTLLKRYNIALPPQKQQQLVMDLTRQDDRARKRLLTEFVAGDPETGIENISRYVESLASISTKILMRPKMERLTSPFSRWARQMWNGDKPGLDQAKAKYDRLRADPGADPEAVKAAKYDYQTRKYMYDQTVTAGDGLDTEKRVNMFRNQLGKAIAFSDDYRQIVDSDIDANGLIARWRSLTAQFQLGFSAATALLNPVSVYTNTVPYLASRNAKTGFGGGFGLEALGAVNLAFAQVGTPGVKPTAEGKKFNTAEFYEKIEASTTLQKKYRLSAYEARMLKEEIRDGSMQPAQTNMLMNTARGASLTNFGRIISDVGMFMFNTSEQASRRAAGLAAFRLQFARLQAAIDPNLKGTDRDKAVEAAYREAKKFVSQTLRLTVGGYSAIERPNAFRGGIGGILYMYKVFPVTSIQLFNNMGIGGKAGMAMTLFLLGGLSALPFAEDFEDVVDTLDQQFGIGFGGGSIRATAMRELEKVFPGWSKNIISGFVGGVLPGDVGSRVALSPIPGTEMFLAGADRTQQFMEIAGPMPAALEQSAATIVDAIRAPFSPTVSVEDVARQAPVTAVRLLADSYAYYASGAVIDRRGYVVAPDVQWYDIAARIAGFYPTRAADDYGTIRVINRIANYRRERAADYRARWVSYRIRNDRDGMREIEEAVRDWNKVNRGTPLEITNFREGANRAYREATRPAVERTLRTTPTAGRSEFEVLIDYLTR